MPLTPSALNSLIEQLVRLPGIGPKTAQRLAFHLLKAPREDAAALADAMLALKDKTRTCARCFNLAEAELCPICQDSRRDRAVLCVVEELNDLLAIEKIREFRGVYHVLGGSLSPLDGRGPEQIRAKELLSRLEGGEVDLDHLGAVGKQRGDDVAHTYTLCTQCVHELVGAAQQLARRHLVTLGGDEGEVVGVFLGQGPEAEVTHTALSSQARDAAGRSGNGSSGRPQARTCSKSRQFVCPAAGGHGESGRVGDGRVPGRQGRRHLDRHRNPVLRGGRHGSQMG